MDLSHIFNKHILWMPLIGNITVLILCSIVLIKACVVYAKFDHVRSHQVNFDIFRCYYSLVHQSMTYILWIMFTECCIFINKVSCIIHAPNLQFLSLHLICIITEVLMHLTCARVLVGSEFSLKEYGVIYKAFKNGNKNICPNLDKPFSEKKPFDSKIIMDT